MKNSTFTIIVTIYNVEEFLNRCLESIVLQCYKNYEVIMVSDKSSDGSDKIVSKYEKNYKNFKRVYSENTGLAKAKNIGIQHATGKYIIFLDGDDFLEPDFLEKLSKEITDKEDVIRFQVQEVIDNDVRRYEENEFDNINGIEAFKKIINYHFVEPSWAYCYKRDFWNKNNFRFMNNCIAEDFGLTPLIIYKAKKVKSINYIGYNYVQRTHSLMSESNYDLRIKKMEDMLLQADFLKSKITNNKELFYRFINESLITYVTSLKYRDYRKYLKKMKKNHDIFKYIPKDNFKRKIKKMLIVISPYMFKKVFRGYYDKS